MIQIRPRGEGYPKSARLRKSRDFRFASASRVRTNYFTFVYKPAGSGRLGVSISKKVLRNAVARNRVRRLIREVFRMELAGKPVLAEYDLHLVGLSALKTEWRGLSKRDVEKQFEHLYFHLPRDRNDEVQSGLL